MSNNYTYEDIVNKDILELLGVGDIPNKEKRQLYQKMIETIQNRIIARIDGKLTEEEVDEWKKLIDAGDKAKMDAFLKSKGINLVQLLVEEALIYKMELIDLMNQTKKE